MLGLFRHTLSDSRLYDSQTFYSAFERDLTMCRSELLIESPFITTRRLEVLAPTLRKLAYRGVGVTVNTKPLYEQEGRLYHEAQRAVDTLQEIGVNVLFTGGHHRKLAVIDRQILWEGSLNILSQNDSCEIMRRITSPDQAEQMLAFIRLNKFL